MGLETTASWSRIQVDSSSARDAAIEAGRKRIAAGEADVAAGRASLAEAQSALEAGRAQLAEGRAALEAGEARLEAGRAALSEHEASAASYRKRTTLQITPFDDAISSARSLIGVGEADLARGRRDLAALKAAMEQGEANVSFGSASISNGDARLQTGRDAIARHLGMSPTVVPTGNGHGLRISAGWGTTFGRLHLGAEGDVGMSSEQVNVAVLDRISKVSFGMVAGASLRTGWVVHPRILAYGSGGWEGTEWRYSPRGGRSSTHFQSGARIGGGVEVHIGEGFLLRGGYDRSIMGTGRFLSADISPARDTVRIGLLRVF